MATQVSGEILAKAQTILNEREGIDLCHRAGICPNDGEKLELSGGDEDIGDTYKCPKCGHEYFDWF